MDNGEKRVLWMGVSPFEPDSEMASSLVKLLGLRVSSSLVRFSFNPVCERISFIFPS